MDHVSLDIANENTLKHNSQLALRLNATLLVTTKTGLLIQRLFDRFYHWPRLLQPQIVSTTPHRSSIILREGERRRDVCTDRWIDCRDIQYTIRFVAYI